MFYGKNKDIFGVAGFTMVEILIAITIISVAFMAMSGTSISVIKGNKISRHSTKAIIEAQAVIEDLKNRRFYLGADGILGNSPLGTTDDRGSDGNWNNNWDDSTGDDLISARLRDPDCSPDANNDCTTLDDTDTTLFTIAQLFANPDYAALPHTGGNIEMNPTITISATMQVVWNIRDNGPLDGVKNVLVIVGWQEAGADRYITMSTMVAGWRHLGEPYTK